MIVPFKNSGVKMYFYRLQQYAQQLKMTLTGRLFTRLHNFSIVYSPRMSFYIIFQQIPPYHFCSTTSFMDLPPKKHYNCKVFYRHVTWPVREVLINHDCNDFLLLFVNVSLSIRPTVTSSTKKRKNKMQIFSLFFCIFEFLFCCHAIFTFKTFVECILQV